MADTVTLDPGSGGAVISTDDLGATGHVQWVKLRDGTDGGTQTIASGGGTETAALRVTVASDSTGVLSVDDNGGSLTVDNAALSVTGGGAEATALRVTIASDSTGVVSVDDNGGSLTVDGTVTANLAAGTNNIGDVDVLTLPGSLAGIADDAAFTVGTSVVLPVGFLADQSSTDSVNEGDVGAARMTLDRKQIVTTTASVDTEGASVSMNIDVDETEDAVKASAGKILGWYIYNDGASEVYVKFYNDTTANVTVGTTVPVLTIPIPAGSASNIDWSGFGGYAFSAAITIAATTGVATADTGAPAANQVVANVFYL